MRTLVSLASFFLFLSPVIAQKSGNFGVVGRTFSSLDEHLEQEHYDTPAPAVAVRGTSALWSEDFGGGFPSGWESIDQSGINPWKWSTNGSHGFFTPQNGNGYMAGIESTTAGNGFLINDPDSANHFTYGQPSGANYQYLNSYVATNALNLGGSYQGLVLQFQQAFRFNNTVNLEVMVSPDSVNWTTYQVQGTVQNNTASVNPMLVSINISAAVAGSQSVYLRIGWNARVYYWMIDDMAIYESQPHDLKVNAVYVSHNSTGEEYARVPVGQLYPTMLLGAEVTNFGYETQNNLQLDAEVRNASNAVVATAAAQLASVVAQDTVYLEQETVISGFAPGNYIAFYVVESDDDTQGNINFSDNSGQRTFAITQNVYSLDGIGVYPSGETLLSALGTNSFTDAEDGFMLLNYYDIRETTRVASAQIMLANGTVAGGSIIVSLYDTVDVFASAMGNYLAQAEIYDVTSADVTAGQITIPFDSPVELTPGAYFIGVEMFGGSGVPGAPNTIRVLDDLTVPQPFYSTMIYIPNDQVYSNGNAAAIRLNTTDFIGIEESHSDSRFMVYPNPVSGDEINVRFTANSATVVGYQIYSATGAQVMAGNFNASVGDNVNTIAFGGLSEGMYFLQTSIEGHQLSSKFVVTK